MLLETEVWCRWILRIFPLPPIRGPLGRQLRSDCDSDGPANSRRVPWHSFNLNNELIA